MAATVVLSEANTALETVSDDIANVNMGSVDETELTPGDAPITAQADGHSFEKWILLKVTDMGGSSQVDNVKIWLSDLGGGWQTEEGMSTNLIEVGYVESVFDVGGPVETDSAVAVNVMPEAEPTGANLGIGGVLNGTIEEAPSETDYCVLQLDVTENTEAGAVNQKTLTFQWDEM